MHALFLVGIIGLVLLNIVITGILLWISCKLCRIKRREGLSEKIEPKLHSSTTGKSITFRRAQATTVLALLVETFLGVVLGLSINSDSKSILLLLFLLEVFISLFVVRLLCIWLVLRPSLVKSFFATLLWALLSVGYAVCFILVAKTFLFEAFIIPTGGMAETILGEHKTVECEQCGYQYPVNFIGDPLSNRPQIIESTTCPNCRWESTFLSNDQPIATKVTVAEGGDRILVAKSLLKSVGFKPDRWDEVTFRFPVQEAKNGIPQIYDKRLIGLGGETIVIHQGKLHVLSAPEALQYDDASCDPSDLWRKEQMHEHDPSAVALFQKGQSFSILRKRPDTILELMRLVYDNDKPAKDMKMTPRWAWTGDKSPWTQSDRNENGFRFSTSSDQQEGYLHYQHLLRSDPTGPQLITDFLSYNSAGMHDSVRSPGGNWVSDLILEVELVVQRRQGTFVMELAKGSDRFQASWDLATGECSLNRLTGDNIKNLAQKPTGIRDGPFKLRFANVDARLVVWVNEELPFGDGIPYEEIRNLAPNKDNDLQPARVYGKDTQFEVHHLRLFRDTYYTCQGREPDVAIDNWSDPEQWAKLSDVPIKTYYVQPGHFFVLGDNSAASSDSRSWGLVPNRLMVGKALLIYYPWERARFLK
jgi:signal peptidase I